MALRLSTGFVNARAITGSIKSIMANSVIAIYSGTQPVDANDVETGILLMNITINSGTFTPGAATNGLNMDQVLDGVLSKAVTEVWSGVGLPAAGVGTVAGWFRWYNNNKVTGASITAIRVDGSVGTTLSYQMRMSSTTIIEAIPALTSTFTFSQPRQ